MFALPVCTGVVYQGRILVVSFVAVMLYASLGLAVEVFVPSRLLIRMQRALLGSNSLMQGVDFEEISIDAMDVDERLMIGLLCAYCNVEVGQGQRVDILTGLGEVDIFNEFEVSSNGSRNFKSMSVIVQNADHVFDGSVKLGETLSLEVESLHDSSDTSIESFPVQTWGDNTSFGSYQPDSSLYQEFMSVSDVARTCNTVSDNTLDLRPIRSLTNTSRTINVKVTGTTNLVTQLPYSVLPEITVVLSLYLTPIVITLEVVSLLLLFVDLGIVKDLKSAEPVPHWVYATINLVWFATVVLGSLSIYSFVQVQKKVNSAWVGCGTWSMYAVEGGFVGRYRCQEISLRESTAWYAYLMYLIPVTIIAVITLITLFAQYQRHQYGLERGLRRSTFRSRVEKTESSVESLERSEDV